MNDPVIAVQGLSKSFGKRKVVDALNITVERGEIFGFLGPNGSGKTTTIRMLCGLLTPDAGQGQCLGHDIRRESRQIKREVGYMTQRFSFYEDLSIRENLAFVAAVYCMPDRRQTVDRALDRLGLRDRSAQLAGSLSGGWKQRMALAACLLHEPQLLLLDEPTAGVDPKARREFWNEIHRLAGEGIAVLVSTHYMDEAERCHRLAYMAYGRLLAQGTPQELVRDCGLSTWTVSGAADITVPERSGVVLAGSDIESLPALDQRGADVGRFGPLPHPPLPDAVSRADLNRLAVELSTLSAVEQVVPFGESLHVSGPDEGALDTALQAWRRRTDLSWHKSAASLEDVFISLMKGAKDNAA